MFKSTAHLILSKLLLIAAGSAICLGCQHCGLKKATNGNQGHEERQEISTAISEGDYSLILKTSILDDTLAGRWESPLFGSPIIERQHLVFLKGREVIRSHSLPIKEVEKAAAKGKLVSVTEIPILEICLVRGGASDYYSVSGAADCNGVGCPEFAGIYTLEGSVLYEGISTTGPTNQNYPPLQSVLAEYSIDLRKTQGCQSLMHLWK
ncbi:MAG: hypothetical protein KDD02_16405 [Phaeodactylibacter sp.]|nr:hypothetical protein [Phaeodactylibacter sp.]